MDHDGTGRQPLGDDQANDEERRYPFTQHRELSVGTLRVLIRNTGLTVDEFLQLLSKWRIRRSGLPAIWQPNPAPAE